MIITPTTGCLQGGETVFPHVEESLRVTGEGWSECARKGLAVHAKKGNALLFYSLKPNGDEDVASTHGSWWVHGLAGWLANPSWLFCCRASRDYCWAQHSVQRATCALSPRCAAWQALPGFAGPRVTWHFAGPPHLQPHPEGREVLCYPLDPREHWLPPCCS